MEKGYPDIKGYIGTRNVRGHCTWLTCHGDIEIDAYVLYNIDIIIYSNSLVHKYNDIYIQFVLTTT